MKRGIRGILALAVGFILMAACVGVGYAGEKVTPSKPDVVSSIVDLGASTTGKVIVQFDVASSNQGSGYKDGFIGIAGSSADPKSEADFPIVMKATEELDTGSGCYIYMFSDGGGLNAETVAAYGWDTFEHYEFTIDLESKTYSGTYAFGGMAPVFFADNYAFKPGIEMDDVGKLAVFSEDESLTIKNLLVLPAEPESNEWRSAYLLPGMETGAYPLGPDNAGVVTTEFDFVANIEGVTGAFGYVDTDYSAPDPGLTFKSLPIIFNLNVASNEFLQIRNGSAYVGEIVYEAGKPLHFKTVVDLNNKTMDVWVDGVQVVDDCAFRADAETSAIDDLGKMVIFSLSGPEKVRNTFSILNHTVVEAVK